MRGPFGGSSLVRGRVQGAAVVGLRDPRAIPFLVRVLDSGTAVPNALADFGPQAFPAVVEALRNPTNVRQFNTWTDENTYRALIASGGLLTLRFMIEDGSLGEREVAEVREAVRAVLTDGDSYRVVSSAIDLVPVFGDVALWGIVETLAVNRAARAALVTDVLSGNDPLREYPLNQVREHARRVLAGDEPRPTRGGPRLAAGQFVPTNGASEAEGDALSQEPGPDSSFYILDGFLHQVLRFDQTGEFVMSYGRQGQGPSDGTSLPPCVWPQ